MGCGIRTLIAIIVSVTIQRLFKKMLRSNKEVKENGKITKTKETSLVALESLNHEHSKRIMLEKYMGKCCSVIDYPAF